MNDRCLWCGHFAHGRGTACGATTLITHERCECPGEQRVPARTRRLLWSDTEAMLAERAMRRNGD